MNLIDENGGIITDINPKVFPG